MPRKRVQAKRPLCFIAMPFTSAKSLNGGYSDLGRDELDTVYKLFQRILRRNGYEVRRSESLGDILADVVLDLDRADLVCADLTGLNPNVMYELGIRHGFTKKTLVLTQDVTELPFDLRAYHSIEYGWKTEREQRELGLNLKNALTLLANNPDVRFGPVHSHLGTKRLALHEEERQTAIVRLSALYAELDYLWGVLVHHIMRLPGFVRNSFRMLDNRLYVELSQLAPEATADFARWRHQLEQDWPRATPAIDFLLSTGYVSTDYDQFRDVTSVYRCAGTFRYQMHNLSSKGAFEMCYTFLNWLLDDVLALQHAIEHDQVGQDLRLRCKRLYKDPIATDFLEAPRARFQFPDWEPMSEEV